MVLRAQHIELRIFVMKQALLIFIILVYSNTSFTQIIPKDTSGKRRKAPFDLRAQSFLVHKAFVSFQNNSLSSIKRDILVQLAKGKEVDFNKLYEDLSKKSLGKIELSRVFFILYLSLNATSKKKLTLRWSLENRIRVYDSLSEGLSMLVDSEISEAIKGSRTNKIIQFDALEGVILTITQNGDDVQKSQKYEIKPMSFIAIIDICQDANNVLKEVITSDGNSVASGSIGD
jgi:hypothetical protein